jgi:hypothetical protein
LRASCHATSPRRIPRIRSSFKNALTPFSRPTLLVALFDLFSTDNKELAGKSIIYSYKANELNPIISNPTESVPTPSHSFEMAPSPPPPIGLNHRRGTDIPCRLTSKFLLQLRWWPHHFYRVKHFSFRIKIIIRNFSIVMNYSTTAILFNLYDLG